MATELKTHMFTNPDGSKGQVDALIEVPDIVVTPPVVEESILDKVATEEKVLTELIQEAKEVTPSSGK